MSDSKSSPVFMFDGGDPEMPGANEKARATFKYFWRELAWERRRIVPGVDLACIKAPFSDGPRQPGWQGDPQVEHMWLNDVDFDGRFVTGVLLNNPNWLKSVKASDQARIPLAEIGDWLYVIRGEVYGAYTVNLMRSRMKPREMQQHDAAWGLNFGDPHTIRIVPTPDKSGGFLKSLFGKTATAEIGEHPMSENMGPSFRAELAKNPSMATAKYEGGWTFLHHQALAGSVASVKILLQAGADPNAVTEHGMTPLQLAESLGWEKVIALLKTAGARRV